MIYDKAWDAGCRCRRMLMHFHVICVDTYLFATFFLVQLALGRWGSSSVMSLFWIKEEVMWKTHHRRRETLRFLSTPTLIWIRDDHLQCGLLIHFQIAKDSNVSDRAPAAGLGLIWGHALHSGNQAETGCTFD